MFDAFMPVWRSMFVCTQRNYKLLVSHFAQNNLTRKSQTLDSTDNVSL